MFWKIFKKFQKFYWNFWKLWKFFKKSYLKFERKALFDVIVFRLLKQRLTSNNTRGSNITFTLGTRAVLAPTSFGFELLYFLSTDNLFVLRLGSGMSKAWSAINDKIEFVNFQVKLMLLFINIMGFVGGPRTFTKYILKF